MNDKRVTYFDRFISRIYPTTIDYDSADKNNAIRAHIGYMLNRTQSMFKWTGLPDTIPQRSLELFLQTNGNVCFYEHNDVLRVFTGGMGGEPDAYYMPTIYTIANPALQLSVSARIDVDCVVMPNDSMYLGLIPLFTKYAHFMTENELSIEIGIINTRLIDWISAPDDRTKRSAEKYLQDVKDGKQGVIAENGFFDGIKVNSRGANTIAPTMNSLIEMEQYLKASWYNELGLNANYNMKRESLNTTESQMNNDALLPLVDDMLRCRKESIDKVNAMFDTSISVELASSWQDNEIEIAMQQGNISGQPENENRGGNNADA